MRVTRALNGKPIEHKDLMQMEVMTPTMQEIYKAVFSRMRVEKLDKEKEERIS